jgi:RecA/RadA recombinase
VTLTLPVTHNAVNELQNTESCYFDTEEAFEKSYILKVMKHLSLFLVIKSNRSNQNLEMLC